jgi:dTDP-4-dehydrorhamnose 3,5-epimerase
MRVTRSARGRAAKWASAALTLPDNKLITRANAARKLNRVCFSSLPRVQAKATALKGALLVQPVVHGDARGFFQETYREDEFAELGIQVEFVQDNHSRSQRGVLRGMHFQVGDGQAKLVRCARGAIHDVIVDLRRGSPTYGEWEAHALDDERHLQLYVPAGFAHGFCVTSDLADVIYKCSTYYDPELERGIAFDDPDLGIDWPDLDPVVSERDAQAPRLAQIADELPFEY